MVRLLSPSESNKTKAQASYFALQGHLCCQQVSFCCFFLFHSLLRCSGGAVNSLALMHSSLWTVTWPPAVRKAWDAVGLGISQGQ